MRMVEGQQLKFCKSLYVFRWFGLEELPSGAGNTIRSGVGASEVIRGTGGGGM